MITLNKGATYASTTIKGAGIQLTRLDNPGTSNTLPGWVRTDETNAQSWEIVPPNHPFSAFAEIGNGLAVCNVSKSITSDNVPVVGLRTTKASGSIQNLILKPDGNVGIGYADTIDTISNFPSSLLHIESTAGNQITLGSGKENNSENYVRTFLSSPISGNSNVILAVGRREGTRATNIRDISSGFRLAYNHNQIGSSSTLTLACTQNDTTFSTPNLTFFRNDGTALFTSNLGIDNSKFFRMYNSTFSVLSQTTNITVEVNGANGAMRIGNGANVVADPSAGSLTLGSHVVLNADTAAVPTTTNRPGVGRRGMLRFNDTNNSAEIFDGSNWADVGYYAGLPLGAIIAYPSSSVPGPSFKLCDGGLMDKASYKDLFDLIQYTYGGSGDSFNLPNIQGRAIVGLDVTDASFGSLGRVGGFKTHTLSQDEMPQHDHTFSSGTVTGTINFTGVSGETIAVAGHTHSVTDSGHQHDYLYRNLSDPQVSGSPGNYTVARSDMGNATLQTGIGKATISESTAGGHSHAYKPEGTMTHSLTAPGGTTSKTGGNLAHNNLQPYIVLNYFIKVKKESSRYTSAPLVSDIRVKRNIQILNSNQAIEMIRLLQPKRYEYIDSNISEFTTHIGFIAQEAKLCIPESVRMKKEFIPNVYSMSNLTIVSTNADYKTALITSIQKPITTPIQCELREQLSDDLISIKNVKLKIFNQSKECFCVSCIESIDEYNIMVKFESDMSSLVNDTYFVYGQEIADYHYMNNDAVFSTLVSAFQELDNRVKKQDIIIEKISNMLKLTI